MTDTLSPLRRVERALLDSETRLQQVLDNSNALVFAKDSEGRYLFVNREFERVAGRPAADVLGRRDEEVFSAELATRFRHNDLRVLREGRAIEFEESGEFGGEPRTFLSSKFPLFSADGDAYAVCGIATDITERKRLEEALVHAALAVSESEGDSLYRGLVRYLATILGVDGAFIATLDPVDPCNLDMLAFYLDGKTLENFSYPRAGTPCETVVGQGFRFYPTGLTERFPNDLDFRNLELESYAGHPLCDSGGRQLGLLAVVSRRPLEQPAFVESVMRIFSVRINAELERLAASEALRTSEASYREIFEASEDAIFVHDWDSGAIVDANPRACVAYGYSREELLQVGPGDLSSGVPPYTAEEAARWIERARREGQARVEWHRRNRDGSLRWDEVRLKAARIGGKPRILAFTRDISELKDAEERRARLEAQLRQAQRMEAIGQLTGGIAHDFNNLLTSIMGYVTLASEREAVLGDRRLSGYLAQARSSCERARDLIQQMLMFSRGQRGSPRTLDLASLVGESLDRLRPMLPATVQVSSDLQEAVPRVRTDPLQVEQVLLNLCINARDAVGESGRVEVAVRFLADPHLVCSSCRAGVTGSFVEMVVADTGHGIPPDVLERIFEPFFSTKEVGKGTGMGLAMVHGIVHEHGGHVVVDSQPGRGSRFRVMWPAVSSGDEPAVAPSTAADRRDRVSRPRMRGTALIVDDEAAVGEFMRELLGTWGLEATFVSSPQAAIELIAEEPGRFDVVVTDQAMPRMTGLELARAIRDRRATLPVVLYTGYGRGIAPADLQSAGIRAVLGKPIDPAALEDVLTGILGHR